MALASETSHDGAMPPVTAARPPAAGDRLREPLRTVMRPGVIVVSEDASAAQAHRALLAHGVHAVLVLERSGRAVGWATPRGVLGLVGRDAEALSAADAVTEKAVVLEPFRTVHDALEAMQREGVARILVAGAAGRMPEGVVTEHDLLAVLVR